MYPGGYGRRWVSRGGPERTRGGLKLSAWETLHERPPDLKPGWVMPCLRVSLQVSRDNVPQLFVRCCRRHAVVQEVSDTFVERKWRTAEVSIPRPEGPNPYPPGAGPRPILTTKTWCPSFGRRWSMRADCPALRKRSTWLFRNLIRSPATDRTPSRRFRPLAQSGQARPAPEAPPRPAAGGWACGRTQSHLPLRSAPPAAQGRRGASGGG